MLITNGRVATFGVANEIIEDGAVRVEGDKITDLGASAKLKAAFPDDEDDWYYFDLGSTRSLVVLMTNSLSHSQLVLYDQNGTLLVYDGSNKSTKTVTYSLQRGYVRVYTDPQHGFSATDSYGLTFNCQ